ncbi:MAG: glycosyltransferase family 39 protein [Candidatus Omnitrophica bacterium]|nr:glycosyltransferase family 39 protein [Candidatus Omnitrophota bacterium]
MLGNNIINLSHPDEVFYAGTAKEMALNNSWSIPYLFGQPQFEKPILTYWLLRVGYIMFGVDGFGARFFPALFAMLGVIAVYLLGLLGYKDEKKAFISALILMSAGLYVGLARLVFTDMIFSVLILWALLAFFWGYTVGKHKGTGTILFFIFSGLAVLTKGPLGFLLPLLIVILFLFVKKELRFFFSKYSLLGFTLFLIVTLPWYILLAKKFGSNFAQEFFYNDHVRRLLQAEHKENDTWYFYPASMIIGMFPFSIFVVLAFFSFLKRIKEKMMLSINLLLGCWVTVIFAIFTPAHSKLVSYTFPVLPALALLTGDFIYEALASNKRRVIFISSLVCWFILLMIPVALFVSTKKFSVYVPVKEPVYNFIFLYLAVLAIMLFFTLKKKFLLNFYFLVLQALLILLFVFSSQKNFQVYVSAKTSSEYLLNNYTVNNAILCSKLYVRGVRFFTEKPVAVINVRGANFFSPHPIPYLDTDEKVASFLRNQSVTYCILSKSSLIDAKRVAASNSFKLDILKPIGDEYVVKIQTE